MAKKQKGPGRPVSHPRSKAQAARNEARRKRYAATKRKGGVKAATRKKKTAAPKAKPRKRNRVKAKKAAPLAAPRQDLSPKVMEALVKKTADTGQKVDTILAKIITIETRLFGSTELGKAPIPPEPQYNQAPQDFVLLLEELQDLRQMGRGSF